MSRIRSVHPGLASDEAFMTMTMAAKAAWPLLWTECDDAGVFEWKPIVLKARIFPAESLDFAAILSELVELGCVKRVEIEGKPYGLIRNFGKYQRPKSPAYKFPRPGVFSLPEEHRAYVAVFPKDDGRTSPDLPQPFPSYTEISAQMEDGGGKREEEREEEKESSAALGVDDRLFEKLVEASGASPDFAPDDVDPIRDLIAAGYSLEDHILPVLRTKRGKPFKSWKYFADAIRERAQNRSDVKPAPKSSTPAEGVWVDEGSALWGAISKARGKPPFKTWHGGKPGAFVRLSEIPTEGQPA